MDPTAPQDTVRYERKFLLSERGYHDARSLVRIHPCGFAEAYPPRTVNNVYFDSPGLRCLHDTLFGVCQRYKVRLRWYGGLADGGQGVLQFKMKEGFVGTKAEHPVPHTGLEPGARWSQVVANIRAALPHEAKPAFDAAREPTLINRYERDYFVSADGALRLTIDRGQCFYDQTLRPRVNMERKETVPDAVVLELKYAPEHEAAARQAAAWLPVRLAANSKYVAGVGHILSGRR